MDRPERQLKKGLNKDSKGFDKVDQLLKHGWKRTLLLSLITLMLVGTASAIDINSSRALQYYGDGSTLDLQTDTSGNTDIFGSLYLNGNALRDVGALYDDSGTQCGTNEFLNGNGVCTSVTGTASGDFVNESGDTMTGPLNITDIANFTSTGITMYQPLSLESSGPLSASNGIDLTGTSSNTIESYSTFYLTTSSGSPSDIVLDPTGVTALDSNLDVGDNNVSSVNYINPGGGATNFGGSVDVGGDSITGIGGLNNCGSGEALLGDGTCGATSDPQNLKQVLTQGNTANTSIDMNNNDVINMNGITFNDAGTDGNIDLTSNAEIYNAPLDDSNSAGYLQLVNDEGIAFEPSTDGTTAATFTTSNNLDMQSNNIKNIGTLNSGGTTLATGGDIDVNGNNITDSTGNNITFANSIKVHGAVWASDSGSGSGGGSGSQNLSSVLGHGNTANQTIDMAGNNIDDISTLNSAGTDLTAGGFLDVNGPTNTGAALDVGGAIHADGGIDTYNDLDVNDNNITDSSGENITFANSIKVHGKVWADESGSGTSGGGGSQNLSSVLGHGNEANMSIDMAGNNITSSTTGNVTIGQDLKVYGDVWFQGEEGGSGGGSQGLSEVLFENNTANTTIDMGSNTINNLNNLKMNGGDGYLVQDSDGNKLTLQVDDSGGTRENYLVADPSTDTVGTGSADLDLSGDNITDSGKGNVTIGQDVKIYGKLFLPGEASGDGGGGSASTLAETLANNNSAGDYNIDMAGNNITDTSKGNVSVGQDLFVHGNVYGTGADLAEIYQSDQQLEPGELVTVAGDGKVERTSGKYQKTVGIVSRNPGYVMNTGEEGHKIGLTGKIEVRLASKHRRIEAGDHIVASGEEGKAVSCEMKDETAAENFTEMKQIVKHNRLCEDNAVGVALEKASEAEESVKVLVN